MSKIGRASRNASLMREESVSGTKTIGAAETGEVYLVSAATSVTLPAPKAGAYFKFVITADITSAAALVVNTDSTSTVMVGCVRRVVEGGTGHALDNAAVAQAASADGHDKIVVGDGAAAIHPGSTLECLCDGTKWIVTGLVWANANSATVTFDDQ